MCSILRHAVEYHITPTESARTTLGIGGVEGADDGTGDDVRVCRIKGDGTGCDADALKVRVVVTDVPLNSHHGHPHHIEHDVAASAVAVPEAQTTTTALTQDASFEPRGSHSGSRSGDNSSSNDVGGVGVGGCGDGDGAGGDVGVHSHINTIDDDGNDDDWTTDDDDEDDGSASTNNQRAVVDEWTDVADEHMIRGDVPSTSHVHDSVHPSNGTGSIGDTNNPTRAGKTYFSEQHRELDTLAAVICGSSHSVNPHAVAVLSGPVGAGKRACVIDFARGRGLTLSEITMPVGHHTVVIEQVRYAADELISQERGRWPLSVLMVDATAQAGDPRGRARVVAEVRLYILVCHNGGV